MTLPRPSLGDTRYAATPGELDPAEVVRAVEGWARRELHECAVAVRKLAYSLPAGVGEGTVLRVAEQLHTAANRSLADVLSALDPAEPAC